jgi:hypothetical protein
LTAVVEPLAIITPRPLTVLQRTSVHPGLGSGPLRVAGTGAPAGAVRGELCTVACAEAYGEPTAWTDGGLELSADGHFALNAAVGAGGWFQVQVRLLDADGVVVAQGVVEPVGVGEVFVVAGQSYAASCHERRLVIEDVMARAVAASPEEPDWRYAHDPQPRIEHRIDLSALTEIAEVLAELDLSYPHGEHSPFEGSVWPAFANAMLRLHRVPVALMHATVGATRIGFWTPGSQLFTNLVDAVEQVGDYRALLWQQGESDVAHGTTTDEYVDALVALRSALVERTDIDRPWLVARSTHHPTGEDREEREVAINQAQQLLAGLPGFRPGPDTDSLRGSDHRAGWFRGAHFTAQGQQAAGLMWAGEVHTLLREVAAQEQSEAVPAH